MEIPASIAGAAKLVTAVTVVGGGGIALNELHVASADFDAYIEQEQLSDEREYVLRLKADIREVRQALFENPDATYLAEDLAEMLDDLCELRPEDRLCEEI